METTSIISIMLAFGLYVVLHGMSYRLWKNRRLFLQLSVPYACISMVVWLVLPPNLPLDLILMSWMTYSLLVYLYITCIFGIALTSLRVGILTLIGQYGRGGAGYPEIIERYGREVIVRQRLNRLSDAGIVGRSGTRYVLLRQQSAFGAYGSLLQVLRRVYGVTEHPAQQLPHE